DGLGEAPLVELDEHEGGDGVPHGAGVELRPMADDHPALLELAQPRLHRAARHAEPAGHLEEPHAGILAQRGDEAGVELVDGQSDQSLGHVPSRRGRSAQPHRSDLAIGSARAALGAMFEEGQLYSPVTAGDDGQVTVHLAHDHPGANDPVYRARRNEIAAAALAWRAGEPSPRIAYDEAEQEVWRTVCREL